MSLDLQEYLALLCVLAVTGIALWRRRTYKKSRGCTNCAVAQCDPAGGGKRPVAGGNADPYRPQLFRPVD